MQRWRKPAFDQKKLTAASRLVTGQRSMADGQLGTTEETDGGSQFEKVEVWQLGLEYIDACYAMANGLTKREEFNLQSQLIRAATSVALNIGEGSTSQSNAEQPRFLSLAFAFFSRDRSS